MRFVIDASVGLKWVAPEADSAQAVKLLKAQSLMAPDLIVAEWSNALWKKVVRGEFTADEAIVAADLLARADVELFPMRGLFGSATELALGLRHPAYDCFYLALAVREACVLVTADAALVRKIRQAPVAGLPTVQSLAEAATVFGPA